MASKRTKVFLLVAVGILVLGPLLVLLLLPVWFPWAVRGFTSKTPLTYSRYERVGAGGFRLVDAGFTNAGIKFSAGTVEGPLPTTWAWQHWQGTAASNATPVQVKNWSLAIAPSGRAPSSVYTNVAQALQAIDSIAKYLPSAVASNGSATLHGKTIHLSQATWLGGAVTSAFSVPDAGITGTVNIAREPSGSRTVSLVSTQADLQANLRISPSPTNLAVEGQGTWQGNRLALRATFDRAGTLPETASLQSTNLTIPADQLHLPGYRPVTGTVHGEWNRGQFDVSAELTAEPETANTNYPRAVVRLQATGDTNAAVVETARVDVPWLQANLSNPVRVIYEPPFVTTPASFAFSADLATQPFVPAKGRLTGSLNASRGTGTYPSVTFSLSGQGIAYEKLTGARVQMTGGLDFPNLRLTNAVVSLPDNSSATLQGTFDFEKRIVEGGLLESRGAFAKPWLPPSISHQDASVSARLDGPVTNLSHSGKATVAQLQLPGVPPLSVAAEWAGTNLDLSLVQLGVRSTNLLGDLRAAAQLTPSSARAELQSLSLQDRGQVLLALQAPSRIELAKQAGEWRFSASPPLQLAGRAGTLELQGHGLWPAYGDVRLTASNLNSDALSGSAKIPVSLHVPLLAASSSWSNGPARIALHLQANGKWVNAPATNSGLAGQQIEAQIFLGSSGETLTLSNLVLQADSLPLLAAHGVLPLSIWPGSTTGMVHLGSSAPVQFRVEASSRSALWPELGRLAGLDLARPELQLDLRGSLRSPDGSLHASVQKIAFRSTNRPPVDLRDLVLNLGFDRRKAEIETGRVRVQGQPLLVSGTVPLGERFWQGLRTNALPDWRGANLRIQLTNAPVSSFANLFPSLLVPEGFLNVDLALRDAGAYGNVILSGASLRPVPGLGPIHAIDLKVLFNGPTARIDKSSARFGTSSLLLDGEADIAAWNWREEVLPPVRLTLKGSEVPLSRTPELILRSDLDLRLTKTNGAAMFVTGKATLKKSFFLTDLRNLVAGGPAGGRRSPPFFSIEAPFLAPWRLDVSVTGEKFMKIRSPVFNGQVSANMKLAGTLKEPVALGDVQIDSGVVRFPFTSFQVQQGTAVVTSRDPTRPRLNVIAGAKQFGYDLKLEVSGPADAPILQFSSTPPLSSDRILLMITAGQLPGADQVTTPERRAQAFATFLGRDLINKLGGTEPSEPRLTVQSGQQVTDEGRPTYLVEYMFVDDWYLVGEYDRFNEYNVGVKWRFYSK